MSVKAGKKGAFGAEVGWLVMGWGVEQLSRPQRARHTGDRQEQCGGYCGKAPGSEILGNSTPPAAPDGEGGGLSPTSGPHQHEGTIRAQVQQARGFLQEKLTSMGVRRRHCPWPEASGGWANPSLAQPSGSRNQRLGSPLGDVRDTVGGGGVCGHWVGPSLCSKPFSPTRASGVPSMSGPSA